jgi:hypothetical protein
VRVGPCSSHPLLKNIFFLISQKLLLKLTLIAIFVCENAGWKPFTFNAFTLQLLQKFSLVCFMYECDVNPSKVDVSTETTFFCCCYFSIFLSFCVTFLPLNQHSHTHRDSFSISASRLLSQTPINYSWRREEPGKVAREQRLRDEQEAGARERACKKSVEG